MLRVSRAAGSGIHEGKVFLSFIGEDRKHYDILLPPVAALQTVLSILRTASNLELADVAMWQTEVASLCEQISQCLGA